MHWVVLEGKVPLWRVLGRRLTPYMTHSLWIESEARLARTRRSWWVRKLVRGMLEAAGVLVLGWMFVGE